MNILDYSDFMNMIKEGLITTHNIEKYKNSMINSLSPLGYDFSINIIDKFKFEVDISNIELDIELFLSIVNNYGYYPSSFILYLTNGMFKRFKFDLESMKRKLVEFKTKDYLVIRFESKYNEGLYRSDLEVPDFLYHIYRVDNIDKIRKNGLIPKSRNRLSTHPNRIHFCYSENDCDSLINRFKLSDFHNYNKVYEYGIVKIDCRELKDKIILHTDPNFLEGCFTYDNIDPSYLIFK